MAINQTAQPLSGPAAPPQKARTSFGILGAISLSHLLNDMIQSLILAIYPLLQAEFSLTFVQIGMITLTFQLTSSLFQPVIGYITDKRSMPWSLPVGMCFTLCGLILLALAGSFSMVLLAALLAIVVLSQISRWYAAQHRMNKGKPKPAIVNPLPRKKVILAVGILLMLIFSKYFYMASISSYYTFYLMHKFGLTVQNAQLHLFAFLFAVAAGTVIGGPVGDKIGRKYVIWGSILGVAPFTLVLPYASLEWTGILTVIIGFILASAFSAILVYAQELLPGRIGMVSGLFFGFAFGMGGLGAAVLGLLADHTSIDLVYKICAFLPLLGFLTIFLPDNRQKA